MALLLVEPLPRNATPGELVRFLCDAAGLDSKHLGKILFQPRGATVEVADTHASKVVAKCDGETFRERRVRVQIVKPPKSERSHFAKLAELLEIEAAEERRRLTLAAKEDRAGADETSLRPLAIRGEDYGLGGRLLLTFAHKAGGDLPPHRLGPGSPVQLTQLGAHRPLVFRAVVSERSPATLVVALEEPEEELPAEGFWRLDLSPDEASRQRQLAALWRTQSAEKDRLAELRELLLGEREPELGPLPALQARLNDSQEVAVQFALASRDVACVHGPPGTGKTTTVVEFIRRAVADGEKVLATAPSNAAVDNLLEKLLAAGLEPVRLGHPARVAGALRAHVLDLLAENHPDARTAKKLTRQAYAKFHEADRWSKDKPHPGEKNALRAEARDLLAEARRLEQNAIDRILDDARVICATLTGVDSNTLGPRRFDRVVIDEACQATEPASWIPVLRGERLLFAGDPCQLPPTIFAPEAARRGLSVSLMERTMSLHPSCAKLLTTQYRMHESIMAFSNAEFYGGQLVADARVASHRLCELPGVLAEPLTEAPVRFIDTAGASYDEAEEPDTGSKFNAQEAALAATKVRGWLAAGVPPQAIAVISPYSAQVRRLRDLLRGTGVEVDSIDGFQGREKEAVLISFVRSNPEGQIGFLSDTRRTNVALTRARRALLVIGDGATLGGHEFYARLLGYFEGIGAWSSVWEEP